ncbi:MAG: pyridoxamine 5'-phosphate oxidase family protein [Desulforegulaceae bacterium]|nr:pyridoxamine 5'-phosphate oxidase family protein [Desulforegulaceae bacterium]
MEFLSEEHLLSEIKKFIKDSKHCVLATSNEGIPYCSLMAYINNDDCTQIYLASYWDTQKVKNLKKNKNLSLLIDSRGSQSPKALTIQGEFLETDKGLYDFVFKKFLKEHPEMEPFLSSEKIEFISVNFKAFMYIKGLEDTYFIDLS